MSEQEIAAAMDIANDNGGGMAPEIMESADMEEVADTNEKKSQLFISADQCVRVFDLVNNNTNLIDNWKKVNLTLADDGTDINDTKGILVGIDKDGVPFSFNCKNHMIPSNLADGITEIRVLLSGIIIKSRTASIYVSKNNTFCYIKNPEGITIESLTYFKARGGKVGYRNNGVAIPRVDVEMAKLTFKVAGGRIYDKVMKADDIGQIRDIVTAFMNNEIIDINYCIKIENTCFKCGI